MSFGFGDVLFFAIFGSILYVFYRWITGMPILPWKESDVTTKKASITRRKIKVKVM